MQIICTVILMLTPDYAELQLNTDSFRVQNNPVTSENDEISASRFKYANIISHVKMQQGNSNAPPVKYIFNFYGRTNIQV